MFNSSLKHGRSYTRLQKDPIHFFGEKPQVDIFREMSKYFLTNCSTMVTDLCFLTYEPLTYCFSGSVNFYASLHKYHARVCCWFYWVIMKYFKQLLEAFRRDFAKSSSFCAKAFSGSNWHRSLPQRGLIGLPLSEYCIFWFEHYLVRGIYSVGIIQRRP